MCGEYCNHRGKPSTLRGNTPTFVGNMESIKCEVNCGMKHPHMCGEYHLMTSNNEYH